MKEFYSFSRIIALLSATAALLTGCAQFDSPVEITETATVEVITTTDAKCTLYRTDKPIMEWIGSKTIPGLLAGSYSVSISSLKLNSTYQEKFQLSVGNRKVIETAIGSLDIKVKSDFFWQVLKSGTQIFSGVGSQFIDSLWTGDYTVKVKVNPLLPDYEFGFTVAKQQVKVIEPGIGSFVIKTKSDYQNTLFRDGVQVVSWSGAKEFLPCLTGNYLLKSKMFPSAPPVEQNFTIAPNENRTIEWDYGKIEITGEGLACKLKRDGQEILSWQGSKTLDSLIAGNYSVEIQEPNSPFWSEVFLLSKDQTKNVAIPYGSITVTTNVPSTTTKLIFNGSVSKSLTGNGTISNIVPGNYTLSFEAAGYAAQTETITISNGQQLQKEVTLRMIAMVYIPAGTFTMGCTSEQSDYCYSNETPTHQVTLSAYEIGKYEVTQSQWRTVMGSNPSYFTGDNKPVERVSWYDVINFCNTLSTHEGLTPVYTVNGTNVTANWSANGYRLPTEAEWEYAARGGASTTNTLYSGSNNIGNVAWYSGNSGNTTHDVGTKSPNQLGIYDMSGNVWEWCWDWYSGNYYSTSPLSNPKGPDSGSARVLRGGSWDINPEYCRVAFRNDYVPDVRYDFFGFRLIRTR